jgi:hypothetical protein
VKAGTLNKKHPCCDQSLFQRYDALYRGGPAFRRSISAFLPANPLEAPAVYELRKRDAFYRSYVGPIIDFFSAQLFGSPFLVRAGSGGETATPDLFYSDFREDVDMNGTDLVTFMKARFVQAMTLGAAWILAELPSDDGLPAAARADWEARGLGRVRLCPIGPEAVLDWECDDYGQLLWAITYRSEKRRDDPRLERQLVTETWRLYDRQDVETFQVVYDPAKRRIRPEDEIPSVGREPHRFPRVPLVQLRLPEGLWLLNRAADAQVEHFRLSAALSWAIKRACYPMAVFHAADQEAAPIPVTGAGYTLKIGLLEKLEWVSPATAPFEVVAGQIAQQKDELYRIAQQMASSVNNNATTLNRSGDSKNADAAATEICLLAYSVHVKAAVEDIFELVSDGRGDFDIHFSIEGMSSFSLGDITVSLANMKLAVELEIPSTTLRAELAVKAAGMLLPDASQDVRDKIRAEIEEGVEEEEAAPPAPALPPNGAALPSAALPAPPTAKPAA